VIAGIILAAGASSRMGSPKALLDYRGETFVGRLIRVFSNVCDSVIVVAGVHAAAIEDAVAGRASVVVNPDPDRGQLSSLQTALVQLPKHCEGFLFTPVDCPTVDERTVATLADRLRAGDAAFVIPKFNGKRGHPVCARGSMIAEFLALPPTDETRAVVNRHGNQIEYVDVDDAGVLADVDDLATYRQLVQ
jgi:molybdenum cofactor cytidylyltransferase